jgi:predicted HicB family RNase H-like nuclease
MLSYLSKFPGRQGLMEKTPKNIKVDPELWRRARAKALVEGMTLQQLITKLLKEYVGEKK